MIREIRDYVERHMDREDILSSLAILGYDGQDEALMAYALIGLIALKVETESSDWIANGHLLCDLPECEAD